MQDPVLVVERPGLVVHHMQVCMGCSHCCESCRRDVHISQARCGSQASQVVFDWLGAPFVPGQPVPCRTRRCKRTHHPRTHARVLHIMSRAHPSHHHPTPPTPHPFPVVATSLAAVASRPPIVTPTKLSAAQLGAGRSQQGDDDEAAYARAWLADSITALTAKCSSLAGQLAACLDSTILLHSQASLAGRSTAQLPHAQPQASAAFPSLSSARTCSAPFSPWRPALTTGLADQGLPPPVSLLPLPLDICRCCPRCAMPSRTCVRCAAHNMGLHASHACLRTGGACRACCHHPPAPG